MNDNKQFLSHLKSLRGRSGQDSLPRYRKRSESGSTDKYAFACRLKKAPHIWLVIHQDFWGFMPSSLFHLEYATSNECARKQRVSYAKLDASNS